MGRNDPEARVGELGLGTQDRGRMARLRGAGRLRIGDGSGRGDEGDVVGRHGSPKIEAGVGIRFGENPPTGSLRSTFHTKPPYLSARRHILILVEYDSSCLSSNIVKDARRGDVLHDVPIKTAR